MSATGDPISGQQRRGVCRTVVALAMLWFLLVAAAAAPTINVVPEQPVPGERVTVRGGGFCPDPCSQVTIAVDGSVAAGNVAVAGDGTFSVEVGLTPVAGSSTIVASQSEAGGGTRTATAIVRVVASDQAIGASAPPPSEPAASDQALPGLAWMAVVVGTLGLVTGGAYAMRRARRPPSTPSQ